MTINNINRNDIFTNVGYLEQVFFILEKHLVYVPYLPNTFNNNVQINEELDIYIEAGVDLLELYFTPRAENFTESSEITRNGKSYKQQLTLDIPKDQIDIASTIQAIANNKVFIYYKDRNGKFKLLRNMVMTSNLSINQANKYELTFEHVSKIPAKFVDIVAGVNLSNAVVGDDAMYPYEFAAERGRVLRVEDFPRLWIQGLYYLDPEYKGNTFEVSGDGFVYAGNEVDYAAVTSIDLSSQSLTTDFNFLDKFGNLVTLSLHTNQVSLLNVTYNVKLTSLHCYANQIEELDLTTNTELLSLVCRTNQIGSLDLTNNTKLDNISAGQNPLNSLDFTYNTELTSILLYLTNITNLDFTYNIKLISLQVYSNQLVSLTGLNSPFLSLLHCANNQIEALDLNNCPNINTFFGHINQFTSLDFTNCPLLNTITLYNNFTLSSLTGLNYCTLLSTLTIYSANLVTLNISANVNLINLRCHNNELDATVNSEILIDLDANGKLNGYFQSSIFGGGTLTAAGLTAKSNLQSKGWNIVGI